MKKKELEKLTEQAYKAGRDEAAKTEPENFIREWDENSRAAKTGFKTIVKYVLAYAKKSLKNKL